MGFGEYLSSGAEEEFIDSERRKEEWEFEHCPEEEKREMVEIYIHRYGFSKEDAEEAINLASKYKEFFISHMMAEELGLLLTDAPGDEGTTAASKGLVMFASFAAFGLVPLAAFFVVHTGLVNHNFNTPTASFFITALFSCVTLFILGVLKSKFVAHNSAVRAGLTMVMNGGGAGFVAFLVGTSLQHLAGTKQVLD
mmetsp:Transcript_696/g.796  ORF Transcript_696/g.796 Transcript_696/m.796 type:complete len:196 (+) Transcript_696:118-705(+)